MSVKLGFTGTRKGMTSPQQISYRMLMTTLAPRKFHHGDCVGSDDQAATIAATTKPRPRIIAHPPVDDAHRAFNDKYDDIRPPKTHFARNRDIVHETDLLVATPWQTKRPAPKTGGGTWYTIEYALKQGKMVKVIWPNGKVETLIPSPKK